MRSINVTLPDELNEFLESQASARGYKGAGDYVRQILGSFWKEKAQADLESKLIAASDGGPAVEATPEFWADLRVRVHARAKAQRP